MRTLLASLVLAAAGVFGAASPAAAHGPDVRVFVSFGDVAFVHGRPYHRHLNLPLAAYGPPHAVRYFYYAPRPPVFVAPAPHHHHGYYREEHRYDPRDRGRPGYPRHRDGYYR